MRLGPAFAPNLDCDGRCVLRSRRQVRDHGVKERVQLTTDGSKGRDDGDADEGGNQAILDGRGAALVAHKLRKQGSHFYLSCLASDT